MYYVRIFCKKEMERILFPSPDDTEMVETLGNFGTLNDDAQPKISNTVYLPRILVFLMGYLTKNLDSRSNCLSSSRPFAGDHRSACQTIYFCLDYGAL